MNIFITGGMGFVGKKLTRRLIREGHSVTILERAFTGKGPVPEKAASIEADATLPGRWQERLADHDVLINLAGVSIFSRWSKKRKNDIYKSRIAITKNIADALARHKGRASLLLNASAVGYYGFHGDDKLDEASPPGEDFLASVCTDWEAAALAAEEHGIRVIPCRFGVVLGKGGGALEILARIFRLRLGSRLGSGNQWFSWIHEADLLEIFLFLLKSSAINGPINCTTPNAVTNRQLTAALNQALDRRSFVPPAPAFMIRLIMGEFGSFILKGQRAVPGQLTREGFTFKYPEIDSALNSLLRPG
jgi:uncharacterized protein (TIGR01777 family)